MSSGGNKKGIDVPKDSNAPQRVRTTSEGSSSNEDGTTSGKRYDIFFFANFLKDQLSFLTYT